MRLLRASACVLVVAMSVFSQSPVARYGNLSVEGNRIVGENGQTAQLRGMSFFWSQWGEDYWNSNVVSWLASDWKVDLVRAAMGVVTTNPEDPAYLDDQATNKNRVKTVVDAAIDNGLYVIIDWHDHDAHQHESQAIAFFEDMARTYGNQPNVIYEIFNEPKEISWSGVVKPYSERVISAIRAIDPDNLILVGTPRWCQDVDVAAADPINATNIAYTLHFYAASHKGDFRAKAQSALDNDVALFVSEFGTCEYDGNGYVDEAETSTWFSFLDQNKISWANWSMHDKNESASALVGNASDAGGWPESQLTQSGTFIRNKLREYASANPGQTYYSLTTGTTGSGTVTPAPGSYESGSGVTLSAEPAQGWVFEGWSGDASGTSNQVTITMNSDKNVTATFVQQTVDYSLTTSVTGEGTIGRMPDGSSFEEGTQVTLSAEPADGWVFESWGGGASGTTNPLTITMGSDKNVTATFVQQTSDYSLTTSVTGEGTIGRMPDGSSFEDGTRVTLSAEPADGWVFESWGDGASGTSNQVTITMNSDKNITATFVQQTSDFSLTTSVTGEGTIGRMPDGSSFEDGTQVTLSAEPADGWVFESWGGGASGTTNPLTITMDSDKNVTATFVEQTADYSLTTSVTGEGTIVRSPQGGGYDSGTEVTLTANPADGYVFSGWGGDAQGTDNPLTVLMDADKNISATFEEEAQGLVIQTEVMGQGSITKSPEEAYYDRWVTVQVSALPADGWRFDGWEGDAEGTNDRLWINMDASKSLTARFTKQFVVTADVSGQGSITLSPDALGYDSGTVVTATANPADGYRFAGWSGDVSGTQEQVSITLDGDKSITAEFEQYATGIKLSWKADGAPADFLIPSARGTRIDVSLYDLRGRHVACLFKGILGKKMAEINLDAVSPGSYLLMVRDHKGNRLLQRKFIAVR